MQVSSIASTHSRRNLFIKYANNYMNFRAMNEENEPVSKPESDSVKTEKTKGIETLTIFPKQVIEGKTVITA